MAFPWNSKTRHSDLFAGSARRAHETMNVPGLVRGEPLGFSLPALAAPWGAIRRSRGHSGPPGLRLAPGRDKPNVPFLANGAGVSHPGPGCQARTGVGLVAPF